MLQRVFILLILVSHSLSDSCVTYTFEEGYPELFHNESGICASTLLIWDLGRYEDIAVTDQNVHSTKFISPGSEPSCVSSFVFSMSRGGIVEVNMYMDNTSTDDTIEVMVIESAASGFDYVVGSGFNTPAQQSSFVRGWHTLKVAFNGSETFNGYITLVGRKRSASVVLVDSFRYIPLGMNSSECEIYPEMMMPTEETTVVTETTTQSTTTMAPTTSGSPATSEVLTTNEVSTTTELLTTTNAPTTSATSEATTLPVCEDPNDIFWTPLRIGLLMLFSFLIGMLLCSLCFCCLRSNAKVVVVKA